MLTHGWVALLVVVFCTSAQAEPAGSRWWIDRDGAGAAVSVRDKSLSWAGGVVTLGRVKIPKHASFRPQSGVSLARLIEQSAPPRVAGFENTIARLGELRLSDSEAPLLGKDFLNRIEVVEVDGEWELRWTPPTGRESPIVADLRNPELTWFRAAATRMAATLVETAVGFVPAPIVAGLLSTALHWIIQWEFELRRQHEEMLFAVIDLAEDGDSVSPFLTAISGVEREQVATSLWLARRSSWWDAVSVVVGPARAKWRKERGKVIRGSALRWQALQSLDPGAARLCVRFALGGDGRLHDLYKKRVSMDPRHPHLLAGLRIARAAAAMTAGFGLGNIPWVGGILGGIAEWVLVNRDFQLERDDSRIEAILSERQLVLSEDWRSSIAQLKRQRANPFELVSEQ